MHKVIYTICCFIFFSSVQIYAQDYQIQPVTFSDVQVNDQFWTPVMERNAEVTLPHIFDKIEQSNRSIGSTVYKTIEGASYILQVSDNPALRQRLDSLIAGIAAAQDADGYISEEPVPPSERWVEPYGGAGHEPAGGVSEPYSSGHLFEAAVAHYRATGQRNLLDIAIKNADLLVDVFGWGKLERYPNHSEIELALTRLFQVTGNNEYLDLAKFFLDVRGPDDAEYNQAHQKVTDQHEAVGHAVRAMYLYSGLSDIAAHTDSQQYHEAADAIWDDVVNKKLYITGGVGSNGMNEGFEESYKLPNMTAYNETCASIAYVFWNLRMFLSKGDARYIDVLERTMYNGTLSGVSLRGDRSFFPNPLESFAQHRRASWSAFPCGTPNLLRFLATVPGYVYAQKNDELFVNLFMSNTTTMELSSGQVEISQSTDYPWQGRVDLNVTPEASAEFAIKIRIPGWTRNRPVPGPLYQFMDSEKGTVAIRVNGELIDYQMEKGYAVLKRRWNKGDKVTIDMVMEPRKVVANPKVEADRGRFALQRGPLVYTLEGADHQDGKVRNMMVSSDAKMKVSYREDLLNGTYVMESEGTGLKYRQGSDGVVEESKPITAIPYFLWANRGPHEMMTWIPYKKSAAEPTPSPPKTLASTSTVRASEGAKNLDELNNQYVLPVNQHLPKVAGYFRWPLEERDKRQWAQYIFERPAEVSSVKVHWYDNDPMTMTTWYDEEPWPRCRVPDSWRLYYRDQGGRWQPVQTQEEYKTEPDQYNVLEFEPVTTRSIKLEVRRQESFAACVAEWSVN
jgi:DUF1680 family protein